MSIIEQLSEELRWDANFLEKTVELFDNDLSIHFIARYRKNLTGGMDAEFLNNLKKRYDFLVKLQMMKEDAINKLKELHISDDYIFSGIYAATNLSDVREIMAPYRSKRETKASKARELGLQPLADIIMGKYEGNVNTLLKELNVKNAIVKCKPIIAEEAIGHPKQKRIAEDHLLNGTFKIKYRSEKDEEKKYEELVHLTGKVSDLSPHQIMAIFRAVDNEAVRFQFKIRKKTLVNQIFEKYQLIPPKQYIGVFKDALTDGITRLLLPRTKRSVLNHLKEYADDRAIEVFKANLENLLLQSPIIPRVILAIDPGYVNGCKIAVVDELGKFLEATTIYPTNPKNQIEKSSKIILRLIEDYSVEFIAIGNGTASKETMAFVKQLLKDNSLYNITFAMVPETGASVYSASEIARQELPEVDVSHRGAVSIARRILDPLNELVKIDPKSLGVGQYQHDVDQKKLQEALEFVMEKCINQNGIYINNASISALSHVAGLSEDLAQKIITYRDTYRFNELRDLYNISGIGEKTFEQAAGFIRISDSKNLLDVTLIHPINYQVAIKIIEAIGKNLFSWNELLEDERESLISNLNLEVIQQEYDVGNKILADIIEELILFGQDPRGIKEFVDLSKSPDSISELEVDMILDGEVRNVVDFGCFIDLGIKQNGLVHISKMATRYITSPHSIVKIGDRVKVKILDLDTERKRISLELLEVNGEIP